MVVALAALSLLAAPEMVTLAPPGTVCDGGVVVTRASTLSDFFSHFITLNCVTELMTFMCMQMYALHVIPHYHDVLFVYLYRKIIFILYIITFHSMFYAFDATFFLLYFIRNENKDDQS